MKLFICVLILFSFVYSKENIKKQLPLEQSSDYIKAQALYNTSSYKKSYELFYKLFKKNLQNVNVNYYLALNAIELNQYNLAIAALDRVLILNPNDFNSKYQLCRVTFLMGNIDSAFEMVNALKKDIKDSIKIKKVDNLINQINKKRKNYTLEGFFLLGAQASDNVNNGVSKKYLLPDFFDNIPQGNSEKADNALIYMLNLNFKTFDFNNSSFSFENEVLYLNKIFSNEKEENFEFYSYSPTLSYLFTNSKLNMGLTFGRYKPSYNTKENDFDTFGVNSKYLTKDYSLELKAQRFFYRNDSFKDKNYTRYEGIYKLYDLNKFDFEFSAIKDNSFHSSRTDLDKYTLKGQVQYRYTYKDLFDVTPSFLYRKTNYENESIAFNSKRKDNYYSSSISFRKVYKKKNIFDLSFEYVRNDSNHAEYDYNSSSLTFYYVRTFRF